MSAPVVVDLALARDRAEVARPVWVAGIVECGACGEHRTAVVHKEALERLWCPVCESRFATCIYYARDEDGAPLALKMQGAHALADELEWILLRERGRA